jgi:hypothetical protein
MPQRQGTTRLPLFGTGNTASLDLESSAKHRVGHSGEQVLDLIIARPSGELVKELLKRFP